MISLHWNLSLSRFPWRHGLPWLEWKRNSCPAQSPALNTTDHLWEEHRLHLNISACHESSYRWTTTNPHSHTPKYSANSSPNIEQPRVTSVFSPWHIQPECSLQLFLNIWCTSRILMFRSFFRQIFFKCSNWSRNADTTLKWDTEVLVQWALYISFNHSIWLFVENMRMAWLLSQQDNFFLQGH